MSEQQQQSNPQRPEGRPNTTGLNDKKDFKKQGDMDAKKKEEKVSGDADSVSCSTCGGTGMINN